MTITAPVAGRQTTSRLRPPILVWAGGVLGRTRRSWVMIGLALACLAPVCFVFARSADARRDIVYWDEFDTALALVLKLREGTTPGEFLQDLFSINNEHRMVTSRLLFAGSYWLTGTIDFTLIRHLGNATLVAMCLLLVWTAGTGVRRLRMGVLLACLLFQFEHYENFLWGGASIDHFQVVFLASAALVALARGTPVATLAGAALATLATFTLTHGIAVWPVGVGLLLWTKRWRELAIWGGIGAAAVGGFFIGFHLNDAESFVAFSFEGLQRIAHYWLAILGAVPAMGHANLSPYWGGLLLLVLAYGAARSTVHREPVALPLAWFAVCAAGLIAIGRAEHSGGQVFSRYYVLSALAWALGLFLLLERHSHPRRPLQFLVAVLPALIGFNLFANREFSDEVESWLNCRDIAAVNYKQHGADGFGPFRLHPNPERSTRLLQKAAALGVYHLGAICLPEPMPRRTRTTNRIAYYVEEIATNTGAVSVRGWAAIPGQVSQRGSIHLLLRSGSTMHLFSTVTIPRQDVPTVMKQAGWTNAGFHFARLLDHMPAGDFEIGLLIEDRGRAEFIMTDHRVNVPGAGRAALLASRQ